MGILDIFRRKEISQEITSSFRVGDWVTQYSAGYWKVIAVYPKYADEDYSYERTSWKKGDRIGEWVILKKGFSDKMKPYNACELVDGKWCRKVSPEIVAAIEKAFEENPKAKKKFEDAASLPSPSICSKWMNLTEEQAEAFSALLSALPERFTEKQFLEFAAGYRNFIVKPSEANYILRLYSYLWDIDDDFQPFHFGPEIEKL